MSAVARALVGFAGAALFLGAHAALGGMRGDHLVLTAVGLLLWNARGRWRAPAAFLGPLALMLAVYDAQRYWIEALRGPIRVAEPRAWELAWFGITTAAGPVTPAQWWQTHTHPWLDAVCGAAYLLFVPGFLALAAWWRFRERRAAAQQAMWAMLWLNLAGYATYALYPAAPPWYADHYGLGPAVATAPPEAAGAARFDALFGVSWFADYYGRSANVFGAIPSLHVGQTFLAALFAWRFGSLRAIATVFWAVMLFGSVYLNHHYLVDGIVGMVFAAGATAVEMRRARSTAGQTL